MFGQQADQLLHQVFRKLTLDVAWTIDLGLWTLDLGLWTMVFSASSAVNCFSLQYQPVMVCEKAGE